MADKVARAGSVIVTRQFKNGTRQGVVETVKEEQLEVRNFEVQPGSVSAKYGLTINLGNYESARCEALVTIPCYAEEIDDAFKMAWAVAERELQVQVRSVKKGAR